MRVRATDFRDYIVKRQAAPGHKGVYKEWLCAHFLKLWDLPVPDFAVIEVQPQHIPPFLHAHVQPHHFRLPAFGSLVVGYALDAGEILRSPGQYQKELSSSNSDLLELSLFDFWVSHTDRRHGNYNLLYGGGKAPRFIPIDHESALDSIDYGNPPEEQMYQDSLLSSPLVRDYVSRSQIRDILHEPEPYEIAFRRKVAECRESISAIISAMPDAWRRAYPDLETVLLRTIFEEKWLSTTWLHYLDFLQR